MSWCDIDLARDLVCSPKTRRRIYWGMLLYLVAATGLLVLTANRATSDIKDGMELHRRALLIQNGFRATHPSATSMRNYAEQMKQTLLKNKQRIESVNTALPDKVQTMLPLMVSLINQPGGSQLHKLKFTQQNRIGDPELEFSIRIPAAQRGAADFLQRWKTDELLADQFTTITPANTQRGKIGAGDILIMSYKATFKE